MRFISLIFQLFCAVSGVLAAVMTSEQMRQLKTQNGVIRLTDKTFSSIVEGPRDYTVAVLLTADGIQYGCQFCKIVSPQYQLVGHSWRKLHPDGKDLYFAIADIADCPGAYQMLGLSHAPNLYVYGPTDEKSSVVYGFDSYTFPQSEDQLGSFVKYFSKLSGEQINIIEPFHWDRVALTSTIVAGLVLIIVFAHKPLLGLIRAKQVWVAISLVSIIMFIAGHMFNMIRKTPYVVSDGKGGVTYFVGGHSNQIAVETQIIAVTYVTLAFATISLITKAPKIKNEQAQMFLVSSLCLIILVAYSFLLEKFHIKNGGYPYHLLRIF